jgi:hypothetical protein
MSSGSTFLCYLLRNSMPYEKCISLIPIYSFEVLLISSPLVPGTQGKEIFKVIEKILQPSGDSKIPSQEQYPFHSFSLPT